MILWEFIDLYKELYMDLYTDLYTEVFFIFIHSIY